MVMCVKRWCLSCITAKGRASGVVLAVLVKNGLRNRHVLPEDAGGVVVVVVRYLGEYAVDERLVGRLHSDVVPGRPLDGREFVAAVVTEVDHVQGSGTSRSLSAARPPVCPRSPRGP